MKKQMKKSLSAVLALTMTASLTPLPLLPVSAAENEPAMAMGTSIIADGEFVYFGKTSNEALYNFKNGAANAAIKWKVLDADHTNVGTGDDNKGMFLISYELFGSGSWGDIKFDNDNSPNDGQQKPNEWQKSDAQKWCNAFITNDLSTAESAAILSVSKTDADGRYGYLDAGTSGLTGEQVFFLSAQEANNTQYFADDNARKANFGTEPGYWWLRSPHAYGGNNAGLVFSDGFIYFNYVADVDDAARPAFNANLDSVLFTSAAAGGKSDTDVDANLTQVGAGYSVSDKGSYKLTIKDSTRGGFALNGDVTRSGDTLTIPYTGAQTGANEYISAVIKGSTGNIKYYGRLASVTAESGSVDVTLPSDMADDDVLCLFNEQYNEGNFTDYASDLVEVAIPRNATTKSATITLDGSIGLNLYVDLGTQTADHIVFNGPNGEKSVSLDDSTMVTSGAKAGCYKLTYPVYAKDMDEEVTFTLYNGDTVVTLYNTAGDAEFNSYSVSTYLEAESSAEGVPDILKNLVDAMKVYGQAAKNQFSEGTNNISPAAVSADMLKSYKMSTTGTPNRFEIKTFSLLLESETTLRLYYTGEISDTISVTCGGAAVAYTTGENARGKYIQIPNIAAHDIDNMYTITIGGYSVNVGAYSYMYAALSNTDYVAANPDFADALYALYDYNQKADAYFASLN